MLRSDFHFDLPPALIAQYPTEPRSASRLLVLEGNTGALHDRVFTNLTQLLRPGDLIVCNDTQVIPARLFGRKATGGRVEILVERLLDDHLALAQVRASKPPQSGAQLLLSGEVKITVQGRTADLFELRFEGPLPVLKVLERHGQIPLPPYITRPADSHDGARYQTVYARRPGAVAAPTAGLHFDGELLDTLTAKGLQIAFVTLHVGAGTFQPVRSEYIEDHVMHAEITEVSTQVCEQIHTTRAHGGRVIAIGTTVVRALETACRQGDMQPFCGETRLFIYPGYRFRCVDALVTNFHLPESTLLMLVAAFAGYDNVMRAYRYAVTQRYRFFSYGDAMFITRRSSP